MACVTATARMFSVGGVHGEPLALRPFDFIDNQTRPSWLHAAMYTERPTGLLIQIIFNVNSLAKSSEVMKGIATVRSPLLHRESCVRS